jgi:hemerythrin
MDQNSAADTNTQAQNELQTLLHKVIVAHQQALALLQQTEKAYGRLVPHQLLNLLQPTSIVDVKLGDQVERYMTIMFSDIRDFTPLSESMTPRENFEFINSYLSQMEPVISRHSGIIDKYIGDAIMALFDKSDDALNGALAMLERLTFYNAGRERAGYAPIHIGIGLNTGRVMIGTVGGINRMDSTVIGDAVNLTARLQEANKTYHAPLIISQHTLYELEDSSRYMIRFLDRVKVKGKSQPLSIYEVFDHDPQPLRACKQETLDHFERGVFYYHVKDIEKAISMFKECIDFSSDDFAAMLYLERCYEYQANGQHHSTGEMETPPIWHDDYLTGHEKLDTSHRELLTHINTLFEKIQANQCDDFSPLFNYLDKHTEATFLLEEQLMREHNYPFFDSHSKEHQRFIKRYRQVQAALKLSSNNPRQHAYGLLLQLIDWLSTHIGKNDRHVMRHIQSLAAQQSR